MSQPKKKSSQLSLIVKKLKLLYNLISREPMEDQDKIDAKLKELKTGGGDWIPMNGFGAITSVELKSPGKHTFKPNSGYIVKTFFNKKTGEIKVFPASLFIDDKTKI